MTVVTMVGSREDITDLDDSTHDADLFPKEKHLQAVIPVRAVPSTKDVESKFGDLFAPSQKVAPVAKSSKKQPGLKRNNTVRAFHMSKKKPSMRPFSLSYYDRELEESFQMWFLEISWKRIIKTSQISACAFILLVIPLATGLRSEKREVSVYVHLIVFGVVSLAAVVYFLHRVFRKYRRRWQEFLCTLVVLMYAYSLWFFMFWNAAPALHVIFAGILSSLLSQGFRFHFRTSLVLLLSFCMAFIAVATACADIRNSPEYGLLLLFMLFTTSVWSYISYETERSFRREFWNKKGLEMSLQKVKAANAQLRKQAADLSKQLDYFQSEIGKTADLEGPLEKVLRKLELLSENSALQAEEKSDVLLIMSLLSTSRNILAPNLARQIREGELHLDTEMTRYLFYELASGEDKPVTPQEDSWDVTPIMTGMALGADEEQKGRREIRPISQMTCDEVPASRIARSRAGSGHSTPNALRALNRSGTTLSVLPMLLLQEEAMLQEELKKAGSWLDFDVFRVDEITHGHALYHMSLHLFQQYDLIKRFHLDLDRLKNFVCAIEAGYEKANPYHNAMHACDVLQSLHFLISRGGLASYLTDLDILAALFSAIIHDFEHPGLTNAFHIATGMDKALLYNDRSILENHHVSASFRLLASPKMDFLHRLSKPDRQHLRKSVIAIVLATDLSLHFDLLGAFKAKHSATGFSPQSADDRNQLLGIAIKCADVGHTAKSLPRHLKWTERIVEEFYRQGDQERDLALPISPFMDRTQPNVPKAQIGFCDFLVLPLFTAWVTLFEDSMAVMEELKQNHSYWKGQAGM